MSKKLISLNIEQLESEMSIAGNPVKTANIVKEIYARVDSSLDAFNVSEIQNMGLGLKWIISRLNHQLKYLETRNGQQYQRIK